MDAIETLEHNGLTIDILPDFDGSHANPRDNDNLGTFYGHHRRRCSPDVYNGEAISTTAIQLPVWLYDHGGTAYAAAESNPFHCPWDSGLFGVIFVTLEDVRKEYGVKRVTKAIRARVLDVLKAEVAEYGQWANGEVYGYRISDADGEELDSCWGFLGMDHVKAEAVNAADYITPTKRAA